MSGHSKWASIKHKKAITDAKKSQVFSKIGSLISVAARKGGDPTLNPNLRLMLEKARAAGMPKDNVERAIKRGTGELGGAALEEIIYEAYGPGGIGILIEVVTDNRNRIVGEIRALLNKYNGKMAETGSVSYQFSKKGVILISKESIDEEQMLQIIDAGAIDVVESDENAIVYTDPNTIEKVKKNIEDLGLPIESAEVAFEPQSTIPIDPNNSTQALSLLEGLDNLDDVITVSSNVEL
jgi:YebC/PmpR family DNA-binding regulatory protein